MKSFITIQWFFLILMLFLSGCKKSEQTAPEQSKEEQIYFNSFESPSDTLGWGGELTIMNEAPPSGGKHSIYISGACNAPHAYVTLTGPASESHLILRCWGKNLSNGGDVELRRTSDWYKPPIGIFISDTVWTSYQSKDTLFCPAHDTLSLELTSGGYSPSAMLIDLIEVVRVQ